MVELNGLSDLFSAIKYKPGGCLRLKLSSCTTNYNKSSQKLSPEHHQKEGWSPCVLSLAQSEEINDAVFAVGRQAGFRFHHNYNKILESDWFLARSIFRWIGARAAKVSKNELFHNKLSNNKVSMRGLLFVSLSQLKLICLIFLEMSVLKSLSYQKINLQQIFLCRGFSRILLMINW